MVFGIKNVTGAKTADPWKTYVFLRCFASFQGLEGPNPIENWWNIDHGSWTSFWIDVWWLLGWFLESFWVQKSIKNRCWNLIVFWMPSGGALGRHFQITTRSTHNYPIIWGALEEGRVEVEAMLSCCSASELSCCSASELKCHVSCAELK